MARGTTHAATSDVQVEGRRRASMRITTLAGICLALATVAGVPDARVQAQAETVLSGVLTVAWPDAQPGTDPERDPGQPVFTLHTDDGASYRLDARPGASSPDFRLSGRRVRASVVSLVEPAAAAASAAVEGTPRRRHGTAVVSSVSPAAPDGVAGAMVDSVLQQVIAVTGSQRWVTIACKFADVATEPKSLTFFSNMYASSKPGLDHYWRELSYGQVNVAGSTAHGWYTLPSPRSTYIPSGGSADLDRLAEDCTALAEPYIDFSTVKGINLMFNALLDGYAWGGSSYLTLDNVTRWWRTTWEPPWGYSDVSVIAHEMGHGFGWPHSSSTYPYYPYPYDNAWDVMSEDRYNCAAATDATYGCMAQHTISYHKDSVGWIPSARRYTLPPGSSSTTITIEPLSGLPTGVLDSVPAGHYLMAQAQTGESTGRFYAIEVRKRSGYDSKLYGDGVIIHEVIPNRTTDNQPAHLVDASNVAESADAGAVWTVGETFTDAPSGIAISVDAATATGYVVTMSSGGTTVAAPVVSGVSPSSGPASGGTTITVNGSGFTAQATVTVGGTAATNVSVASSSSLTATTPQHSAGLVAVAVTTTGGTSSLGNSFTYVAAPAISAVSPASVSTAGGATITVDGAGFVPGGTTVTVDGAPVSPVTVGTSSRLTFSAPSHAAGSVTLAVTTAGGTASRSSAYTYATPQPAPSISSISPSTVSVVGGTVVTVRGTGFIVGATTVTVGGQSLAGSVSDAATLTFAAPAHAAGTVSVSVATAWGTATSSNSFTYVNPVPSISGISPSVGPAYGATPVTISGSNFAAGLTTVTFAGVPASSVTVASPTSLTCTAPALGPGTVTVTVANGSATASTTFTYVGAPTLASISPSSGTTAGGTQVTITGTNFVAGMSVTFDGVPATAMTVSSPTSLVATTPAHAAGGVAVRVQSAAGSMTTSPGFTYVVVPVAPTVTAVAPSSGSSDGGTAVVVTGTGFVNGATTVAIGGSPATSVVVTGTTSLTAVTPAHAAGQVSVSATTAHGTGSLVGAFTYVSASAQPTVSDVSPSAGPAGGGTRITISGSNFITGHTAVTVGGVPATDVVVNSPVSVSATTPAGPDGSYTNVVVTTTGGSASKLSAFWYGATPGLTSGTANQDEPESAWEVALAGSGFYPGVTTVHVGTSLALTVQVVDRWHLVATAVPDLVGPRVVTVTNPAGSATVTVTFPGGYTAYLAEGATGAFFDLDIALANPNAVEVPASVTFLKGDGGTIQRSYLLAPLSRTTIAADTVPGLDVGQVDVSTVVESSRQLVVERTMFWNQETYYGGHGGTAVAGGSREWYFAEGYQGFFDTYLLLANASDTAANVTVRFLRESEPPFVANVVVPAHSRQTVFAGLYPELINRGFAAIVESDTPIIAERAMYFGVFPFWRAGHESAGVPAPSLQWSLAEGATGAFFDTYVLVANPNASTATVSFRFLLGGAHAGLTYTKDVAVPPFSRYTLAPEALVESDGFALLANAAVSTFVSATVPIVVERAMYWPGDMSTWSEAHNSFGVTETATRWGLSEGRVGGPHGFETYVLLANATGTDAVVKLTFLREAGSPVEKTVTVAATSRFNVVVNTDVPELSAGERFGVLVESQPVSGVPGGVPISVERAMYWNSGTESWAGGTNATAVKLR